jgi:tripartite-type tricarboxylate transporter receptor subunit TctC
MLLSNSAWAQNITAVVTGPAGSATDTFARAIMKRYDELHGTVTITLNRPGGNGIVGINAFNELPRDSTKILFPFTGHMVNLSETELSRYTGILEVSRSPLSIYCKQDLAASNWSEFVALAKKTTGKINIGTTQAVWPTLAALERDHGISFNWILYGGTSRPEFDVMNGTLDCTFTLPALTNEAMLARGKVIVVFSSDPGKNADASLYRGAEAGNHYLGTGAWVSVDMPAANREKLIRELQEIIRSRWAEDYFTSRGSRPGGSVAELNKRIREMNVGWNRLKLQKKVNE